MTENITTSSNNNIGSVEIWDEESFNSNQVLKLGDKVYLEKEFVIDMIGRYQQEFIPDLIEKINK